MAFQEIQRKLSPTLVRLLAEVETATGNSVRIRDITTHPIEAVRGTFGATDHRGIWMAPGLRPEIAEAIVAHEAMHLLQVAGKWKTAATRIRPMGKAAILHEIIGVLTTAILDPQADSWAQERGFLMIDALQLTWEESKQSLVEKSEIDYEIDVKALRSMWDRIATARQMSKTDNTVAIDDAIDSRLTNGLLEAADYFNMALRAINLGVPFTQEELYKSYLPWCREFGLRLIDEVSIFDLKSRAGAEQALKATFRFLRMNPRVAMIISPERQKP